LKFLSCDDYFPYMNKLRKVTVQRRRRGRNWRRAQAAAVAGGLAAAVSLAAAPLAGAATAGSAGRPLRGIDISAYQHADGPVNWRLLARQGIRFVAIKVTEATYYTNPYYRPDTKAAARAGLAVMPYVFANPDAAGGAATASYAIRAARYRRDRAELPLVVDLENDPYAKSNCYWLSSTRMVAWIARFTARARALTGRWPVIYTTDAWWRQCTGSTGRFGADPLWLAAYDTGWPSAPGAWGRWAFWQYTDAGSVPGIGSTDLDYFEPAAGLQSLRPAARPHPRHQRQSKRHSKQPRKGSRKESSRKEKRAHPPKHKRHSAA
jgi:GH25 family lysozyme M1 (1,4-beta-N-acetylmuramidase)